MAQHVRVRSGGSHTGSAGEAAQAPGGGVAVHPGTAPVEQDRPAGTSAGCPVDGPPDRWRQRDQRDLGAFAAHAQHPVEGLKRRISCIQRMYSSRCGRRAASGARQRSAHQDR